MITSERPDPISRAFRSSPPRALGLLLGLWALGACATATAHPWRVDQIPNGARFSCLNCHVSTNTNGSPNNVFGLAVAKLVTPGSTLPFWKPALAKLDSDGDGYSNGAELGDPNGTWTPGSPNPPITPTNPGDRKSHPAAVNQPPVVSITSPTNQAVLTAPATATLTADASDPDGTVAKVDFYDGATLLGTVTAAPYQYAASLGTGTHSLTAVATDNQGSATTSTVILVTVEQPANQPPVVSITSPTNHTVFTLPSTVPLIADASDPDGTVAKVAFYDGATLLGTVTAPPYQYAATLTAGPHTLSAQATDNQGAATMSTAVQITVVGAVAPVVLGRLALSLDGKKATIDWQGGMGPFAVEFQNAIGASWSLVASNANAGPLTVPLSGSTGIFRVVDLRP